MQEREEKVGKYLPLAADLGKREPRWHVRVGAVVVGSLGTVRSLRKQLAQLQFWNPQEVQRIIHDMQFQTLTAAV